MKKKAIRKKKNFSRNSFSYNHSNLGLERELVTVK